MKEGDLLCFPAYIDAGITYELRCDIMVMQDCEVVEAPEFVGIQFHGHISRPPLLPEEQLVTANSTASRIFQRLKFSTRKGYRIHKPQKQTFSRTRVRVLDEQS